MAEAVRPNSTPFLGGLNIRPHSNQKEAILFAKFLSGRPDACNEFRSSRRILSRSAGNKLDLKNTPPRTDREGYAFKNE
jgi:hypothetical protein